MSLRQFSEYAAEYMRTATQLATYRIARQWWEASVPVADAAAWASLGYQPAEAAPLIADGITPEMAAATDDISATVAGSREEAAMQVIDRLVADGTLIDPRRVRQQQDPNDPDHTIVHIDPDDGQR